MHVFEAWCKERNIKEAVVDMTESQLNNSILHFVHEAVKQDGLPYPPNSLCQLHGEGILEKMVS